MRRLLLFLLLVLGLLSMGHEPAEAALYWANYRSLGRANLDGSASLWFPALEAETGCGLAVDDQYLYWGDTSGGAVGRAAIDGTAPNQAFIPGLGAPCGVAVTGTHVYWTDLDTNMIGRAKLDGSGVEAGFIAGAATPCGIAVDGTHVYWANQEGKSIGRANLDGSDVDQQFISGLGYPCGVAVNDRNVYWGDQGSGSIGRANLDGFNVEPAIVPAAGEPWDVAVSNTQLFWADRWGTPADPNGGIGRAALDGSEVIHDLIPGIHNPTGVATDARLLTATSSPKPSDYLRFGKVTHDRKTGAIQLDVDVPARGGFNVDSPAIGWSIDKGNPPPWVGGAFRWKLTLWPGKGKAGRRIRHRLGKAGRAPIILRITYQQEGRLPLQGSKRLAFQHG